VDTISVCKFKIPCIDPLRVGIYFQYVGINVAFMLLTMLFSWFSSIGILARLLEYLWWLHWRKKAHHFM